MKLKRLDSARFDEAVVRTGLESRTVDMAREVIVFGRGQSEVAAEYGMTRQRVGLAVENIASAYRQYNKDGAGVFSIQVELPEPLAIEMNRLSKLFESAPFDDSLHEFAVNLAGTLRAELEKLNAN